MSVLVPYVHINDWLPVRFAVQVGDVSDEGLALYFEQVEAEMLADRDAGRRFVLVFDPRFGRPPSIEQRLVQARFIERTRPLAAELNLGTALCTPSPLLRGMMNALFWVSRPAKPQVTLPSMRDALDWAIEQVHAAGLELPDQLRDDPDGVLAEVEARAIARRRS